MAVFFTSDLHLGHDNIICYSQRPFRGARAHVPHIRGERCGGDLDAMHTTIIERWRATVADTDTVWVLGDVAMARLDDSLELVGELTGELILVPGNHDRCWSARPKGVDKWRERYLAAGFADIVDRPAPLTIAGRRVQMSHFPYQGDSQHEDRHSEHRPIDRGHWLLCGHVHDAWRQRGRQINVGLDAWGGELVPLDTIAELVAAGPADRETLRWT